MRASFRRRMSRRISVMNGVFAVTLFVLLAAFALVATPPSPPSIAEFAPQAQQQIEEAPDEQSADAVSGGTAQQETLAGEETRVIEEEEEESEAPEQASGEEGGTVVLEGVPSALQCVTWPDGSVTQTFDPQSPPCIATWDDSTGNGGATYRGVTDREILVGMPSTHEKRRGTYDAIVAHVNSAYQLYGRQIRLVEADQPSGHDATSQRALANSLSELGVFAALGFEMQVDSAVYRRTLADHKIVTTTALNPALRSGDLESLAPYAWSFAAPGDVIQQHAAEFACTSLVGRPAEWGGPDVADQTRVFAVLTGEQYPDPQPVLDGLAACGVTAELVRLPPESCSPSGQDWALMAADLRGRGVTTVILLESGGDSLPCSMQGASTVGYTPEWFLPASATGALNAGDDKAGQRIHLFGLEPENKRLPQSEEFFVQAAGNEWAEYSDWGLGDYQQLLLLAAGIQMAGPVLTPESFERGLQSTAFPNPGASAPPYWQATVGFAGDHVAIDDVALWHWDDQRDRQHQGNEARPNDAGRCPFEGGRRFRLGQWPEGLQLFQTPCE